MSRQEQSQAIDRFDGNYWFLSNFYSIGIELDGVVYPSVEHAYQASKTHDLEWRQTILTARTAGGAKRFGRNIPKEHFRKDWEDVKLGLMEGFLRQKFAIVTLHARLLGTGDAELIEGNDWGDQFWGVYKGKGENHLGKLLMKIRIDLRLKMRQETQI